MSSVSGALAGRTGHAVHAITTKEIRGVMGEAGISKTTVQEVFKRKLRRHRQNARKGVIENVPEDPVELSNMNYENIPENLRNVPDRDGLETRFLLDIYKDVPGLTLQDMVIVMTNFGTEILNGTTKWLIDGTFQSCPPQFSQCVTIMALVEVMYKPDCYDTYPAAYGLLPNKEGGTYQLFLEMINHYATYAQAQGVGCDFESGFHKIVLNVYKDVDIWGRLFHLYGNWKLNRSIIGVQKLKNTSETFQRFCDRLKTIPYIPKSKIQIVWQFMKNKMTENEWSMWRTWVVKIAWTDAAGTVHKAETQDFTGKVKRYIQYLEKYYIGTKVPGKQPTMPTYPHAM